MTRIDHTGLRVALDALPDHHRGPGGVAGVVKDGAIIAALAWGYADLAARRAMTRETRLPICSISKQFTCGVLLDRFREPDRLDARVADSLPKYRGTLPTVSQLCHNQSGLRDYWALTVLQGAHAEQTFRREDALPLIARMKTSHFEPGTRYSYCNCNFRIVSDIVENETGNPLDRLYAESIWERAGMATAVLTSDTRRPADDVVGYEGNDATGFFPAENGIFWIGDAGISASLDDMLGYETWIDATRDDPASLYNRLSTQPTFQDGTPAFYGYGLAHGTVAGVRVTGHAGALRGFRAQRLHAASERLSVVVMFNHEGDTHGAASALLKAAMGREDPAPRAVPDGWEGQWICAETGLLTRVESDRTGAMLRYATSPDRLTAQDDGSLAGPGVSLRREAGRIVMRRDTDNITTVLDPLPTVPVGAGQEIEGLFYSEELEAAMVIEARDGGIYAGFEGMLGQGPMERVHPVGPDTWVVATRRSMDAPAPGDWTLRAMRSDGGRVEEVTLGSWLARDIAYRKTG